MPQPKIGFIAGETEHIHWSGARSRKPTVLLFVGKRRISRKAFILGVSLIICQLLDFLLTYIGLRVLGISMEGNQFLRLLMEAYGLFPVLFSAKMAAVIAAIALTLFAHRRKWIRPIIASLVLIYFALAIIPWAVIVGDLPG